MKPRHFVGTIETEPWGFVKIEGYLFETEPEAREFMTMRFKRVVNHILTLTLGKFEARESRRSR